jgi:hypothetical protein
VVLHGGGAAKPVAQGEKSRNIHPLGASRKTIPMAKAVWGVANIGPNTRTIRGQPGPGKLRANIDALMPTVSAVAATPVQMLKASAIPVEWPVSNMRQAAGSAPAITAAQPDQSSGSPMAAISSTGPKRLVLRVGPGRPGRIASAARCSYHRAQKVADVTDLRRVDAMRHRVGVPLDCITQAFQDIP